MSFWKVAAAQYEPRKTSLTEQVAHHLEFVRAAARQQCQLLVFPSLSLLGCDYSRRALPAPPDLSLLDPLCYAATTWRMTIIAGLPVEYNDRFIRWNCGVRTVAKNAWDLPSESWCMSGPSFQNHHGGR
ncbi:putative carbon-nitrogen hydrolase [Escherichia coli]|uniref:Putative carbon-nitrogen hydrolase n=1 Tax=Escherichia coli TaxID=562 RepID=A0A2X1KQE9_ECOLX|nr:putative carbon-nitrogen hydrolase [Escherichia coli]